MHACGHDLHMSLGMGTAALLAQNKDRWHGTFIYIGQPADAEAESAGAEKKPEVRVYESVDAIYNDPAVTRRVANALQETLGKSNVIEAPPIMASDDFAEYRRDGVPIVMMELGAVNPATFAEAEKSGKVVPGPHSPFFAPDLEPSLKTGILVETTAVLELLQQR
jgi:metal-dependent amidase/aminoacylase/carboxypeptidase family protein